MLTNSLTIGALALAIVLGAYLIGCAVDAIAGAIVRGRRRTSSRQHDWPRDEDYPL
jgi:hypothetical protein